MGDLTASDMLKTRLMHARAEAAKIPDAPVVFSQIGPIGGDRRLPPRPHFPPPSGTAKASSPARGPAPAPPTDTMSGSFEKELAAGTTAAMAKAAQETAPARQPLLRPPQGTTQPKAPA